MRIVLASRNAHKITEMRRIAPHIEWLPMPEELGDPPETGATFEENALQKARYVHARTGLWALADDSGLQVDALGGRPGVHSRRYSPEATDAANNRLLLSELGGSPRRTARYVCVIALVGPAGVERTAWGDCEGSIGFRPSGEGGFGYDPLFVPEEGDGRTMAELAPEEKDAISHRGAAMAQLDRLLQGIDDTLWQ
ncbi:MAG: RdgB/HAM1 family non-canonical purine NTP pyrophosphatase [Myxococcota bacterium]